MSAPTEDSDPATDFTELVKEIENALIPFIGTFVAKAWVRQMEAQFLRRGNLNNLIDDGSGDGRKWVCLRRGLEAMLKLAETDVNKLVSVDFFVSVGLQLTLSNLKYGSRLNVLKMVNPTLEVDINPTLF